MGAGGGLSPPSPLTLTTGSATPENFVCEKTLVNIMVAVYIDGCRGKTTDGGLEGLKSAKCSTKLIFF